MSRPPLRLITTFGLGHLRPASGTWGSLPPVVLSGFVLGLTQGLAFVPGSLLWNSYHAGMALVLLIFAGSCIRDGEAAEARFGKKDPGQVVADETAGQCLPLMFLPATAVTGWTALLSTLALAFISFRILDIVKPWPARQLQRVPGGWGILIDDLFAGAYALLIVQVVTRLGWIAP